MIKSIFDRTLALILLILFSPILLITALLIYWKMGKPIFFRQQQPGLNEQILGIYKFRTMTNDSG